ncbi:Hypothetical predicted protein [Cloeon dipterum]|uniref:C-type lectin domain-containing protein n=1 Tax=Cloeon dipterum TaxID=197152 RepID=A0A8S1DNG3_9INSE|nr:Hypothetical predicted protein [Cloeon dipterum]
MENQKNKISKVYSRRQNIVKCCGFKKCIGTANGTANRKKSSAKTSEQFQGDGMSTMLLTQEAPAASGNTDSGAGLTESDAQTTSETSSPSVSVSSVDSSTPQGAENTDRDQGNEPTGAETTKSPSVGSADAIIGITSSTGSKTSPFEIPRVDLTSTTTTGLIVKTTPPSTVVATSVATMSTTSTTSTSTSTTTTTPPPCRLTCTEFNNYLLNPTEKPSPTDGSFENATKCNRKYFVSKASLTRNEAALKCKALDMKLLAVTSLEEMDCLAYLKAGTYWTSGSNEDFKCDLEKKYAWCSTGYNLSTPTLLSSPKFWLSTTAAPSTLERCLALVNSNNSAQKGIVHRNCKDTLPYICQYPVDCPQQCIKNISLFDSSGNLKNKNSYGVWIDIGIYTYLLGNRPMTWLSNYLQCCALGMEALNIDNFAEQLALTTFSLGFNTTTWKANFNYWTSGTWKGSPVGLWSWCEPSGPAIFDHGLTWERGQPDNKNGNESCVHFRFIMNSTGTVLTDRNCSNSLIYACKMPISTTPKPCTASCPKNLCKRDQKYFDQTTTLVTTQC